MTFSEKLLVHVLIIIIIHGEDITIPGGIKTGVLELMQTAFPDTWEALAQHGCWCAYADDRNRFVGGVKSVDYLDDLCHRWFGASGSLKQQ